MTMSLCISIPSVLVLRSLARKFRFSKSVPDKTEQGCVLKGSRMFYVLRALFPGGAIVPARLLREIAISAATRAPARIPQKAIIPEARCQSINSQVWECMAISFLTLPMLRLLSSKAQRPKDLWKQANPCHVGIHWKALADFSQMSTHVSGFRSFFRFFASFVFAKVATSSIRVNILILKDHWWS